MYKAMLTLAFTLAIGSTAIAGNLDMGQLVGLWEVDYDRTMEEGKRSPKYDQAMADRMPDMVKRMMSTMRVKLTDKQMLYLRGTREIALPYTIQSSDANSVTVLVKQGPQETRVVFSLVEGTYMKFKSSASDDMDFYVWKKGAMKKAEEKN